MRAGEARRAAEVLQEQLESARAADAVAGGAHARVHAAEPGAAAAGGWRGDGRLSVAGRRTARQPQSNSGASRTRKEKLLEGLEEAATLADRRQGRHRRRRHTTCRSRRSSPTPTSVWPRPRRTLPKLERKGLLPNHPDVASAKQPDRVGRKGRAGPAGARSRRLQGQAERRRAASGRHQCAAESRRRCRAASAASTDLDGELKRLQDGGKGPAGTDRRAAAAVRFDPGRAGRLSPAAARLLAPRRKTTTCWRAGSTRRGCPSRSKPAIRARTSASSMRRFLRKDRRRPNRLRLVLMGLLLALAAMAAAVVVAEQFDTSFHSVDEVREFTAVPVLATIPQIGAAPRRGWVPRHAQHRVGRGGGRAGRRRSPPISHTATTRWCGCSTARVKGSHRE